MYDLSEVFENSCAIKDFLMLGRKVYAVAGDDNHNKGDVKASFDRFTMINLNINVLLINFLKAIFILLPILRLQNSAQLEIRFILNLMLLMSMEEGQICKPILLKIYFRGR